MTTPAALDVLIADLEAAEEGSRELDAWIEALLQAGKDGRIIRADNGRIYAKPKKHEHIDWIGYDCLAIAAHYTTSLDAALTLVPEGRIWSIGIIGNRSGFVAVLDNDGRSHRGATPALALVIATLRARRSMMDE